MGEHHSFLTLLEGTLDALHGGAPGVFGAHFEVLGIAPERMRAAELTVSAALWRNMVALASTPATTLEDLNAKATLLEEMVKCRGWREDLDRRLASGFFADIQRLLTTPAEEGRP